MRRFGTNIVVATLLLAGASCAAVVAVGVLSLPVFVWHHWGSFWGWTSVVAVIIAAIAALLTFFEHLLADS